MNTKIEVTNTVRRGIAATPPETLERAANECDNYTFQKAGPRHSVCIHGGNAYLISDVDGEVGCSCGDMTYRCHDNEICKHLATYLKRSSPPSAKLDREIAKDLMSAGWTGSEGELRPPREEVEKSTKEVPKPAESVDTTPETTAPTEPPKQPEVKTPGREAVPPTEEEKPMPKMYHHPDGTKFRSAEALLNYAEKCKAEQESFDTMKASTFQLAPMIRGLRPSLRERGRITIGKKGATNASGRGRKTVRYDHFVFTTVEKDERIDDYVLDTEMNDRYGADCREIPVRFLSDNITEIFHTEYAKYTTAGVTIRGDGENWIVYNSDGTRDHIEDPKGERGFLKDPDVKPHGVLTVLVDGQNSVGSVYRYRTTGWNSINGMLASLALCSEIAKRAGGRIAFLPMKLIYSFKWQTPKGQATKKKIPVVTCEFRGDVEELQAQSKQAMQYLASGTEDVKQLASANIYDADDETAEEQRDIAAEFYPGVD